MTRRKPTSSRVRAFGGLFAFVLAAPAIAAPDSARAAGDRTLKVKPAVSDHEPTPWEEGEEPPELHGVRRGDTLWAISQHYFGEPWHWPQLWARNPEITNPHRIYPGQMIRLREPTISRATMAPPAIEPPPPPARNRIGISGAPKKPLWGMLRQVGFVDEAGLQASGTIVGSVEEKILLGAGDQVYVSYPKGNPPKPGDRFTIYTVDTNRPLKEPLSTLVLGYLVSIHGDVIIDELTDREFATGRLVELAGPVERGFRVGPSIHQFKSVAPRPNETNMTARIVASLAPEILMANQKFVVLNRGRRHGVEVGNRFEILRQGDGLRRVLESFDAMDHRFPPHVVAEILAVDVQNETTIGWISQCSRELRVGDLADMRAGY